MVIVRLTVVWQTNLMAQTHEQNQSFSDRALEKIIATMIIFP